MFTDAANGMGSSQPLSRSTYRVNNLVEAGSALVGRIDGRFARSGHWNMPCKKEP